MAAKRPVSDAIELRCQKNADGSFNASCFEGNDTLEDAIDKNAFKVVNGDCTAIKVVWQRLRDAIPDSEPITVVGPCKECLSDPE